MDARSMLHEARRSVRVVQGDSEVRLKLFECLENLTSTSILDSYTQHAYHIFYNIATFDIFFLYCK